MKRFKTGQVVMITDIFKNGKRSRTIGTITHIDRETKNGLYVTMIPAPKEIREKLREKYCESEGFTYHRAYGEHYTDTYGFSCSHVKPETTEIIAEGIIRGTGVNQKFYPQPGDPGFDLMC